MFAATIESFMISANNTLLMQQLSVSQPCCHDPPLGGVLTTLVSCSTGSLKPVSGDAFQAAFERPKKKFIVLVSRTKICQQHFINLARKAIVWVGIKL